MADEDAWALLAAIQSGHYSRCLLPWIPLMRGGERPETIATWKRIAAAEPNSRLRGDYGALALVFAEQSGRHPLWKQALKGWNMKVSKQFQASLELPGLPGFLLGNRNRLGTKIKGRKILGRKMFARESLRQLIERDL